MKRFPVLLILLLAAPARGQPDRPPDKQPPPVVVTVPTAPPAPVPVDAINAIIAALGSIAGAVALIWSWIQHFQLKGKLPVVASPPGEPALTAEERATITLLTERLKGGQR